MSTALVWCNASVKVLFRFSYPPTTFLTIVETFTNVGYFPMALATFHYPPRYVFYLYHTIQSKQCQWYFGTSTLVLEHMCYFLLAGV